MFEYKMILFDYIIIDLFIPTDTQTQTHRSIFSSSKQYIQHDPTHKHEFNLSSLSL